MSDNITGFFSCPECSNPMHRAIEAHRHDSILANIIMERDRKSGKQHWPMAYFQCESCHALSAIVYQDHSGLLTVDAITVIQDMAGMRFDQLSELRSVIMTELENVMGRNR